MFRREPEGFLLFFCRIFSITHIGDCLNVLVLQLNENFCIVTWWWNLFCIRLWGETDKNRYIILCWKLLYAQYILFCSIWWDSPMFVVRFVLWQGGKDSLRIQLAEMIMRVPEEDLQKTVASVMKDLWIEMEKGWRSRCLSICIYLPLSFSLQFGIFGDLVNMYTSFANSQT